MISETEIDEIRIYLNKTENPIFFYDDDPDGLASYLLLKKYVGKGVGIPIKTSPNIDDIYLRKIKEYSPDFVFILDKPIITQEFIDKVNVPIIWIDHHPVIECDGVKYFNPRKENKEDGRPTSYWCYKIVKNNLWVAMCGIVGDWYISEDFDDLIKLYPDLVRKTDYPGDILFDTRFGELIKVFAFILKGKTSDVKKNVRILERIENPYEILDETTPQGRFLYKYYNKINKSYESLLNKAKNNVTKDHLLLFTYPTNKHSLTGYLSNELLYTFPNKVILIGRQREDRMLMSFRSSNVDLPPILNKLMKSYDAYGGGHKYACGGGINVDQFYEFVEDFKNELAKFK